jgi:hypothetical protein
LSRRQIAVFRAAGIDGGIADLNLAVLDWVDARAKRRDGRLQDTTIVPEDGTRRIAA